jgi:hypothetical protein
MRRRAAAELGPHKERSLEKEMGTASQISVIQFAFTAFFAATYAWMLRRADIWYPFTPTRTHEPGEWAGFGDTVRFILAFAALLCLPAIYFVYALLFLQEHSGAFAVSPFPPSFGDVGKIFVIILMVAPPLAFYNLWQVIVRAFGAYLYSKRAMEEIKKYYPVAFTGSYANAVAFALVYILAPIFGVAAVLYSARSGA